MLVRATRHAACLASASGFPRCASAAAMRTACRTAGPNSFQEVPAASAATATAVGARHYDNTAFTCHAHGCSCCGNGIRLASKNLRILCCSSGLCFFNLRVDTPSNNTFTHHVPPLLRRWHPPGWPELPPLAAAPPLPDAAPPSRWPASQLPAAAPLLAPPAVALRHFSGSFSNCPGVAGAREASAVCSAHHKSAVLIGS